jgi:phosphoglycerol transferase MdoB-like AlkP superfamily enzyme
MSDDPYFTNKKLLFDYNGMDVTEGVEEIYEFLDEKPKGEWGHSDQQLSKYVIRSLKQRRLREPFVLVIENVDIHPPFRMKKDTLKYGDGESVILNLAYTSDLAFGQMWDYFINSPYAENTIFLLTADHAMQPGTEYNQLFGKDIGFYDEVPFIIYDPTHQIPKRIQAVSSSVDIMPSLLHLLGINIMNPFEGMSVFDPEGRPAHQNVLGSHQRLFFYRDNNINNRFFRHQLQCSESARNTSADIMEPCDYLDWWKFKRWITVNNKIWNDSL